MPLTNLQGRDSALRCPRRRAQRQATENAGFTTFVPSFGRGRRSAASLPLKKFVKDIMPDGIVGSGIARNNGRNSVRAGSRGRSPHQRIKLIQCLLPEPYSVENL
jgi:hypothetical protein